MGMRLFMVRHGESENNLKRIFTGWVDCPLTEKGCKDAESIRPFMSNFKFDKIYSSDLTRAYVTAKTVLPDYKPIKTALLRECSVGSLGNTSVSSDADCSEILKQALKSRDYTPFGGESIEMVGQRLDEFLKEIEGQELENVAAFAHSGVLLAMMYKVFGKHKVNATRRPNCCIAIFDYINGSWMLSGYICPDLLTLANNAETGENDKF